MDFSFPAQTVTALMFGAARAGGWLAVCPPFNTRLIPTPVKALLSVAITVPLMPRLEQQAPTAFAVPTVVGGMVEQVFIGVALGFVTQLLFAAFQAAGSLVDTFGGFSVAFAFDPLAQSGTAVFGRFYNLL